MITGQIIQTSIDELKAITKVDLGVYDLNGSEVASTMEKDDITTDLITGFAASPADSQVIGVHHLLKIRDEGDLLYVLVARGMTDDVYMVGKIAVSQIQNLVIAYKERFDRNNFFQNLLLDNLLLVDIYNRAKKLHVEVSCPRAVYLIETKDEKDGIVSEVLKGMFSPQSGDYVTAVDESSLILIKSVESTTTPETLHELAETIVAMMNGLKVSDKKILVVLPESNRNILLSARNLQNVKVIPAANLNTYDVMNASSVLIAEGAVSVINEMLA